MIYVNGDSYSKNTWTPDFPYDVSWPNCIQKKFNIKVVNESAGCGSNVRMLENLQRFYQLGHRPNLVLIALTGEYRWYLPTKNLGSWNIGPTVINEHTGVVDETILKWWRLKCVDRLEYVYQYWSTIWKIQEFCIKTMNCPVIFFNAWGTVEKFENDLFNDEESSIKKWITTHIQNKNPDDIVFQKYLKLFQFFYHERQKWNFDRVSWESQLSPTEICGPDDFHPDHPNEKGCEKIATFVEDAIIKYQPEIYKSILSQSRLKI